MAERHIAHRSFVSYIDKSREYYAAHGYSQPYRWAAFDDVPLTSLNTPLGECNVTIVTTSFPHHEHDAAGSFKTTKQAYQHAVADRPGRMHTDDLSWDKDATHTDDTETFLPLGRLAELSASGKIGRVNHRFFGVPTEYSQRRTGLDAEAVTGWCADDGVDIALLIPL